MRSCRTVLIVLALTASVACRQARENAVQQKTIPTPEQEYEALLERQVGTRSMTPAAHAKLSRVMDALMAEAQ
jgi:hypothetical protein